MRVLAACEFSGRIREAFRSRGHDAWSCDLEPALEPSSFHIQADVRSHLAGWDLIIAFPPCTYLTKAGASWRNDWRDDQTRQAVEFVRLLWEAGNRVVIENPVGSLSTLWQKPTQIVEPYWFGDPYFKKTCLWIKGLAPLEIGDDYITGPCRRWITDNRNPRRRSLTFPGIAKAMAEQWGN
jgi:hypothetical protein